MNDDSRSNSTPGGVPNIGTQIPATVVVAPNVTVVPAVPAKVDNFQHDAATVGSIALTLVAFTLNWWSHTHGQGDYVPDWVIGLMWAPWGYNFAAWLKERLEPKPKV